MKFIENLAMGTPGMISNEGKHYACHVRQWFVYHFQPFDIREERLARLVTGLLHHPRGVSEASLEYLTLAVTGKTWVLETPILLRIYSRDFIKSWLLNYDAI